MTGATKTKQTKTEDKKNKLQKLRQKMSAVETEFKDTNLEIERERFQILTCVSCDKPLKMSEDLIAEFMVKGETSKRVECPNCQMYNRIDVVYKDNPSEGTAQITQEETDYSYILNPIGELDKKQLLKRLEIEVGKVNDNTSRRTPEVQLIIKLLDVLKK